MNSRLLSLLMISLCSLLMFSSCKDDDGEILLNHDGSNFNAPELPANTYESAALFPSSFTGNDADNELYAIQYYIRSTPSSAELRVYRGGSSEPDSLIYSANVLTQIINESWNSHTIPEPIILDGENIWITFRYTQLSVQRTLGCDEGPATANGDWLFDSADGFWTPLSTRTNSTININWNLRGLVRVPVE